MATTTATVTKVRNVRIALDEQFDNAPVIEQRERVVEAIKPEPNVSDRQPRLGDVVQIRQANPSILQIRDGGDGGDPGPPNYGDDFRIRDILNVDVFVRRNRRRQLIEDSHFVTDAALTYKVKEKDCVFNHTEPDSMYYFDKIRKMSSVMPGCCIDHLAAVYGICETSIKSTDINSYSSTKESKRNCLIAKALKGDVVAFDEKDLIVPVINNENDNDEITAVMRTGKELERFTRKGYRFSRHFINYFNYCSSTNLNIDPCTHKSTSQCNNAKYLSALAIFTFSHKFLYLRSMGYRDILNYTLEGATIIETMVKIFNSFYASIIGSPLIDIIDFVDDLNTVFTHEDGMINNDDNTIKMVKNFMAHCLMPGNVFGSIQKPNVKFIYGIGIVATRKICNNEPFVFENRIKDESLIQLQSKMNGTSEIDSFLKKPPDCDGFAVSSFKPDAININMKPSALQTIHHCAKLKI